MLSYNTVGNGAEFSLPFSVYCGGERNMSADWKVLIISCSEEVRENLIPVVKECGFGSVSVSDGTGVRSVIEKENYGLVILNTPLAEEYGLELASFISSHTNAALIVAVSQKNCDSVYNKIGSTGAYILPKPFNKTALIQAIRFVVTAREKMLELKAEKEKLEKKLYNIKQIDRAKCVLIQYLRISEADAHRQIQKRAMDQRVPEIEIAMDILKTYEM